MYSNPGIVENSPLSVISNLRPYPVDLCQFITVILPWISRPPVSLKPCYPEFEAVSRGLVLVYNCGFTLDISNPRDLENSVI